MEEALRLALPAAIAVVLALVHLFAGRLRFLEGVPRNRWLSFAGGASVGYVFVHVFPDLHRGQEALARAGIPGIEVLDQHIYLVALVGLLLFYGLEEAALRSRRESSGGGALSPHRPTFWVHLGSFALYNVLVGYLVLHREVPGRVTLALFGLAMALHFLVNDFGLREHYQASYHRAGRFVLAGAVLAGFALGWLVQLHEAAVAVLFAFLAGGVVMNVFKEELPESRQSRFLPLLLGAAGYAALLLAVGS